MLKKHNKFGLNRTKRGEQKIGVHAELYKTRKFKYYRYFIVPVLIASFLVAVLINPPQFNSEVHYFKSNAKENNANSQRNLIVHKIEKTVMNSKSFDVANLGNHFADLNTDSTEKEATDKLGKIARTVNSGAKENANLIKYEDHQAKRKASTSKLFKPTENSDELYVDNEIEDHHTIANIDLEVMDLKGRSARQVEIRASAISCQEYEGNCTLSCSDGSVSYIDYNLEEFQSTRTCQNSLLSLKVTKCQFNFGTLQPSFFSGDFSLAYLSIIECNLEIIKPASFMQNNVKNLRTLILINNQLASLQANTFDGLSNLLHFEFIQTSFAATFAGEVFLKPLANNLQEAIIQPRINDSLLMDPLNWWQKLQMNSLTILDISNTNLLGILNSKTFEPFVALAYLILFNCNLLTIEAEVFDFTSTSNSLKYLDLRFNHLQTFDYKFLLKLDLPGIEVNLNLNELYCECNTNLLQYFKDHDVYLSEETSCFTPQKWQKMELRWLIEECRKSESTITTTTTAIQSTTTDKIIPTTKSISTNTHDPTSVIFYTTTDETTTFRFPSENTTEDSSDSMENYINIICYLNDLTADSFSQNIIKPGIKFSLHTNSATSVTLVVQSPTNGTIQKFSIIYFTNHNDYSVINYTETISKNEEIIYIKDLKPSVAYMFCVVMETRQTISPFDCRGKFMGLKEHSRMWLLQNDKLWFISVNSTVAMCIFLLTIPIVYIIFHHNPGWFLKRKKKELKIRNTTKSSRKVLLRPDPSPLSERSGNHLDYLPPLQRAYGHNDIENNIIYTSRHATPNLAAPISPIAFSTTCSPRTVDYLDVINNDPDYQAIDQDDTSV